MVAARAIFAAECARCHGVKGEGGTPTVLGKKIKVPSLSKGHALSHTDEQLVKIVSEGEEAMPAFKDKLKPEEITTLVRMIRQEFQAKATK
jgi:mono/diheme cytochrome c family protein